jgi:2,4-dienoyl-CoA reductase (NADPH2)
MIGGVQYERIDADGLHVLTSDGPRLIAADTVVICAGQESQRALADALMARGHSPHVIGGADVAAELDAKRAIDQGVRLAATL